jgi:hypothetical protein
VKANRTLFALLPLVMIAGCDWARQSNEIEGNEAVTIDVPRASGDQPGVTPMAERVAVLGLLNKRNGIVRDLTLKPGQAMRVKDVTIRLRACETTAPWEQEKLTGAFVQMDVKRPDGQWVRRFSGWLSKESPSLNVVEDPVYDVWPKSCAMSWPAGPEAPAAPSASSSRSSASKSGGGQSGAGTPDANGPSPGDGTPDTGAPAPEPLAPAEDNATPNNPA